MSRSPVVENSSALAAYRGWQDRAWKLLAPLENLMESGRADLPIEGKASDHDLNADRVESFARPLLLFAHWRYSLSQNTEEGDLEKAERMGQWFRQALLLGTDSSSEHFWGWSSNFHQHSVEMGLMVIGLELSRDWLWDSISQADQQQVLSWLESDIGNGHHWNNHMFFGIFVMEFLVREGRGFPSYRAVIDRYYGDLEDMYSGEGWFMDGMNQSVDFYNAYAWHYYSLWWIRLYGEASPERCEWWKDKTKLFLENYELFFSSQGEQAAFGRSITYRFNATAPFGMAQLLGISPTMPGLARTICERNMDFFLEKPIYQSQGCLSMGWYDIFEDMVESYSCGGSPYWAAKAFSPLLIPLDDPFWTASSEAIPAESSDQVVAFASPGLIVRTVGGESEIINVGSQIASCNIRFGTWKWGKLSYCSSIGFLISRDPNQYPLDAGLTATNSSGNLILGRHYTAPVKMEEDGMACLYSLGHKTEQSQVSVETRLWWKSGWQLILHRYISHQDCLLRHGTYALSVDEAGDLVENKIDDFYVSIFESGKGIAVQALHGFQGIFSHDRLSEEDGPREHIQGPFHVLRTLDRSVGREQGYLACLSWAGSNQSESIAWEVISLESGRWELEHCKLGAWVIEDESLPKLA
ncbi:DUF2264 domain-containing protein [Opitutia bacterium ISCC 51]|nr:DUF2264 domain-containing protein [Opitutae bacterium ISCC 51]QXD26918.1 DUF2264 domain-containing protein [Opitutae bacterium ISCC 52]